MITIKSEREIELMRKAGKLVALCHVKLKEAIKPGITTNELNKIVEDTIVEHGGTPTFKGYGGFPSAVCSSPNDVVIHGFPNDIPLKNGDIISIDIGATLNGYVGDSAWTYPVGTISPEHLRLLEQTEAALYKGLEEIKEGVHLSNVSHAIEQHAKLNKLGVVREFAGHGVGTQLHEAPEILNYGLPNRGPILKEGMTLAVEPMLNLGTHRVKMHQDGWTVSTADSKYSAHFEHTIVVTKDGYEILTKI